MLRHLWSKFVKLVARKAGFREQRAHHFHPGALTGQSVVIDLGAHKGEFSRFIAATYGCSVLGLEANPQLYKGLPTLPNVRFLNLAISSQDCPVTFHVSENLEASSIYKEVAQVADRAVPVTVDGITLDTLLKANAIRAVELLKVDIESAEFQMLESAADETLRKIAQITVEFHITGDAGDFPRQRVLAIARRLRSLGFRFFAMDRAFTDVLFLNPSRVNCRPSERLAMAMHQYFIAPIRRWL